MIIQLEKGISETDKEVILKKAKDLGFTCSETTTQKKTYLIAIGKKEIDLRLLGSLPGVVDIHRVRAQNKMVSREWKTESTVIDLGDGVLIGENHFQIMAGPCSIESEKQVEEIADQLVKLNVKIMRGGVYKPRSSPYSFRGMGMDGLKFFYEICRDKGLKIITEVMEIHQIEEMYPYVDIFQVGSRNSQNLNLLEALGEIDKPVFIKRGISGTIEELLSSAEYVFSCGNEKLMLCERGIRSYEGAYRNTFDLNAIPILKAKTHLPVIADPSHAIGIRKHIEPMAMAAVAGGADGIMIETHPTPEEAFSDGQQSLSLPELNQTVKKVQRLKQFLVESELVSY